MGFFPLYTPQIWHEDDPNNIEYVMRSAQNDLFQAP